MKDENEDMPLVDVVAIVAKVYGAVSQLAVLETLEHDSCDIKAL